MSVVIIPFPAARIVRIPVLTASEQMRLETLAERVYAAMERAASMPAGAKP
ncbi:MAG: hypothetical protein ACREPD_07255 [Stenotrophomonas sp.]|uniref:hypothetical protein n=1 Tax=Stenotrophomonas sp. TaxID=69392 RepID=UPI003D6D92FA